MRASVRGYSKTRGEGAMRVSVRGYSKTRGGQ